MHGGGNFTINRKGGDADVIIAQEKIGDKSAHMPTSEAARDSELNSNYTTVAVGHKLKNTNTSTNELNRNRPNYMDLDVGPTIKRNIQDKGFQTQNDIISGTVMSVGDVPRRVQEFSNDLSHVDLQNQGEALTGPNKKQRKVKNKSSNSRQSTVVTFNGVTIAASSPDMVKSLRPLPGAEKKKTSAYAESMDFVDSIDAYDP